MFVSWKERSSTGSPKGRSDHVGGPQRRVELSGVSRRPSPSWWLSCPRYSNRRAGGPRGAICDTHPPVTSTSAFRRDAGIRASPPDDPRCRPLVEGEGTDPVVPPVPPRWPAGRCLPLERRSSIAALSRLSVPRGHSAAVSPTLRTAGGDRHFVRVRWPARGTREMIQTTPNETDGLGRSMVVGWIPGPEYERACMLAVTAAYPRPATVARRVELRVRRPAHYTC